MTKFFENSLKCNSCLKKPDVELKEFVNTKNN